MHNVTTDPSALENITRAVRAYVDEHRRAKLVPSEQEQEHDRDEAERSVVLFVLPRSR